GDGVVRGLRGSVESWDNLGSSRRPGGGVGARDVVWGSTTFYPENQGMRRFLALYDELARRNGGEANAGRFLPHWFHEAGFLEIRVTTSTWSYTDAIATKEWADTYANRTLQSNIAAKSLEYGISNRVELETIADGWRTWGRHRDAFFCFSHTEVVGWKS